MADTVDPATIDGVDADIHIEGVERFEIVLTNNHKGTYHPGQIIEGHVLLHLSQSIVTRGILVHFSGRADNFWEEQTYGRSRKCVDTVQFEIAEEFFNLVNELHKPGYIGADTYKFPIKFHLAPPLPETYEDSVCLIEYYVQAIIKQDNNSWNDKCVRREILMLSPLDLNRLVYPDVTLPVQIQKYRNLCCLCCRSDAITAFLRLERTGYAPGEYVRVQADVENNSKRTIPSTRFKIIEEREYKTKKKTISQRDTIVEVDGGVVNSLETKEYKDLAIRIPKQQMFNVTASRIFTIRHFLEMTVSPRGSIKNIVLTLKLTLGGVGLDRKSMDLQVHQRLHSPNEHLKRPSVADIERSWKQEKKQTVKLYTNNLRHRRKVRNRRVLPDDTTIDTADYVANTDRTDLHEKSTKKL